MLRRLHFAGYCQGRAFPDPSLHGGEGGTFGFPFSLAKLGERTPPITMPSSDQQAALQLLRRANQGCAEFLDRASFPAASTTEENLKALLLLESNLEALEVPLQELLTRLSSSEIRDELERYRGNLLQLRGELASQDQSFAHQDQSFADEVQNPIFTSWGRA